jgi:hypothetical protein
MGTPPSHKPSVDFPHSLQDTPQLELGNADELISQLAGDEIDRLISSDDNLTPLSETDFALSAPPRHEKPSVDELAAQLDQVFEEIRTRAPSPPPVKIDLSAPEPMTLPEPVLAMRRYDEPDEREMRGGSDPGELAGRRSLLDPIEETPPAAVRLLAWLNAPVMQLSRGPRLFVSALSLASFVGSVAALIYVLMLRRNI